MALNQAKQIPEISLDQRLEYILSYAEGCRERARERAPEYFQFSHLKIAARKHFWSDLLGNLINVFYAPIYVVLMDLAFWFDEMGWPEPSKWQKRLPLHWRTSTQEQIEEFLRHEIFQCSSEFGKDFSNEVNTTMTNFNSRRNEKSDLNLSFLSLGLGYLFFKNHEFSLTQISQSISKSWANEDASSNFLFGKGLGSVIYSIFPPEPTWWQSLITGAVVLTGFALIIYAINASIFLLQIRYGLYHRRILALIDQVEKELLMNLQYWSEALSRIK